MRRCDVYLKSLAVLLLAAVATLLLQHTLTTRLPDTKLQLAFAFSLIQVTATAAMALYLVAQRSYTRFHQNIGDQLRPALQEHVSALAFSGQAWPAAVPKHGAAREVLEECLSLSLAGLRDSGRERVAQFTWDQGFAKHWQHASSSRSPIERKRAIALLGAVARSETHAVMRRALTDPDPAIRTEAARALLASGDPATTDEIFLRVLGEPLLVRVLLTADLKRHARHLLSGTIPALLSQGQSQEIRHCLEILSAWKLAIPGFDIGPLLERQIDLPLVVALLPYVPVGETVDTHLLAALETPDLEIRCAAARAAGQLRLNTLMPSLLSLLNLNARLAVASAHALAQMGAEGERHLHAAVSASNRKASAAAMEALETLAVGIP